MALYQDGILISGANTLPKMTLAEYNALPADQRPTYWERLDADYDDILAEKTDIATVESGTTASRAYSVGELVYVSGTLYKVKTAIASGATFTVGTNVEATSVSNIISDVSRLKGDIQIPATITTENDFCKQIGRTVSTIPDNSSVSKSVLWADHNIYSLIATRRSVYITGLLSCQSSVLSFSYTITSDIVSGIKITGTAI